MLTGEDVDNECQFQLLIHLMLHLLFFDDISFSCRCHDCRPPMQQRDRVPMLQRPLRSARARQQHSQRLRGQLGRR